MKKAVIIMLVVLSSGSAFAKCNLSGTKVSLFSSTNGSSGVSSGVTRTAR